MDSLGSSLLKQVCEQIELALQLARNGKYATAKIMLITSSEQIMVMLKEKSRTAIIIRTVLVGEHPRAAATDDCSSLRRGMQEADRVSLEPTCSIGSAHKNDLREPGHQEDRHLVQRHSGTRWHQVNA
jgi:hypothetical protein